jgi:hypothetical protein
VTISRRSLKMGFTGRLRLERDQTAMKALRREVCLLRGEVAHFKAERNKMNRRYNNLMTTIHRWIDVTWPYVFGERNERDVQRTKELVAAGILPNLGQLSTRDTDAA